MLQNMEKGITNGAENQRTNNCMEHEENFKTMMMNHNNKANDLMIHHFDNISHIDRQTDGRTHGRMEFI